MLFFHGLFSQTPGKIEYAPVGAKWVYELRYIYPTPAFFNGYKGYIEYTVQKDTNVTVGNQNIVCKKIIVSSFKFNSNNPIFYEYLPYTCYNNYTLTFKRNDTIFWLINSGNMVNTFFPVIIHYNQVGPNNKYGVINHPFCIKQYYFNQPVSITYTTQYYYLDRVVPLISIDTMFVLNDTLRVYDYKNLGSGYGYNCTYIENIGFKEDFGGLISGSIEKFVDNTVAVVNLRCYYDPVNGWLNFIAGDCYYTDPGTISAPEYSKDASAFYYFDKKIYFRNRGITFPLKLRIYDMYGKKVHEAMIENPEPVEVHLNGGIYLMEMNNKILKFSVE